MHAEEMVLAVVSTMSRCASAEGSAASSFYGMPGSSKRER
jgi:hypothetical protein